MTFYTTMPLGLRPFYYQELEDFQAAYSCGQLALAWNHLERAHILGQRYPFTHNIVHWEMLKFGFKIKNVKEIIGQIPRLLFGGIKSFVGSVPIGNPGGVNVPPLKSFPIQKELQDIFSEAGINNN